MNSLLLQALVKLADYDTVYEPGNSVPEHVQISRDVLKRFTGKRAGESRPVCSDTAQGRRLNRPKASRGHRQAHMS